MKKMIFLMVIISIISLSCKNYGQVKELQGIVNYGLDKPGPIINLDDHKKYSFGISYSFDKQSEVSPIIHGRVYRLSTDSNNITNLGKFVELEHGREPNLYYSVYAMLSKVTVEPGQYVSKFDIIGYTGGSGPMREIRPEDEFILGIYTLETNDGFTKHFKSKPSYYHGVYWYDPLKILPPRK